MNEILREEFIKIGCTNSKTIAIATQVYLELCEVRRYWNVTYFYHNTLENIYFSAKILKNEEDSIFFPIEVSKPVSLDYIRSLFQLCKNPPNKLYIVIVNSDSTCLYYQIFNGLLEPVQDLKINHQEKSRRIDAVLRKNREIIEHGALCGIPITLPPRESGNNETTSKGSN